MDNQILAKLQDAENTLAGLKALVISSNNAEDRASVGELHQKRYMTMSTVKLIETRGTEVFQIPDTVGLYFIVPNNRVRTAARSSKLRIVRISEEQIDSYPPPAFIQVGDWVYPLMKGAMVYRSEQKFYLFPDLLASIPGSSVGVVLPKSCSSEQRQEFEDIILGLVGADEFPPQPDSFGKSTELILSARTSVNLIRTNSGVYSQRSSQVLSQQGYGKRIGAGFKAGGQLLSRGVKLGASGTANAMRFGATCLKSNLPRGETSQELPSVIVDGGMYAKDVTEKVLDISSSILTALNKITSNLATLTASYVKSSTSPLIDKAIESSGISRSTIDDVVSEIRDVGEGIVGGGLEAYAGMEAAAKVLANSLHENTVEIISHCYGAPTANVLDRAGQVFGNVALAGMNASQVVSPASILATTTCQAGLSLAFDDIPADS